MAERRDRGEGTFWKNKATGQWWAKATHDGRSKRARASSRSDAKAKAVALAAELRSGLGDDVLTMTVQAWLTLWLAAKRQSVKASTHAFYARHAGYAIAIIGDVQLRRLEPQHVRRMMAALAETALEPRSIAHVRAVLMNALNMAMKDYPTLITRNAAAQADAPRVEQYQAHALTEDERRRLLDAVDGVRRVETRGHTRTLDGRTTTTRVVTGAAPHRLATLVHIAVDLGLRRSELLALRWRDVDWRDDTLLVADSKTPDGVRVIPFTPAHAARLRAHQAAQAEEAHVARQQAQERGQPTPAWNVRGLVFCSEAGTPLNEANVSARVFKMFLRWAELPEDAFRLHDLRHTAITDWIESGADPKTAQVLAGHSDPKTTMKIYAHARASSMRPAIEAAEKRRRKQG